MANTSALQTYQAIGNREDLTDYIGTITRHETPIFSGLKKVKASGVYHEWQTDSLTTGSDNVTIEGADYSFSRVGVRSRLGNWAQTFNKTVEVSLDQVAVSVAGLENEFVYQMDKKMKEIATDIEEALITGTGNSGATGTGRRLKGFLAAITTNVETGSGTSTSEALIESMYNDLLQSIWNAGGRPDKTYVNGFQKRQMSAFATNSQRYQDVREDGSLYNYVSVYNSDFGRQVIELDPFMDTDKVLVLQSDMAAVAVLRPITKTNYPEGISDSVRGVIVGALTLEYRNEAANGQITGLSTS